ncbi:hypothetical protein HZS_3883 [Henneguya salminicola]|nr:hypothetical protein HZS_3883 [Henneguya salminicola]
MSFVFKLCTYPLKSINSQSQFMGIYDAHNSLALEDENQAIQMYVRKLEQKIVLYQSENAELLEKYMKLIDSQAETINKINDEIW